MLLTGAEILVNSLIDNGVDTVFGYPGGAVLNIYDALFKKSDKIRHILTCHEQGAAHAADGYARSTGKKKEGERYGNDRAKEKDSCRRCREIYIVR